MAIERSPPTASALARHRMGRSHLPPAVTEYRIASATTAGHSGGRGRMAANAASTSVRRNRMYSSNEGSMAGHTASANVKCRPSALDLRLCLIVLAECFGRGPELAAFVEDFDATLGLLQARVTEAGQLHAAFVQLEGCFEG